MQRDALARSYLLDALDTSIDAVNVAIVRLMRAKTSTKLFQHVKVRVRVTWAGMGTGVRGPRGLWLSYIDTDCESTRCCLAPKQTHLYAYTILGFSSTASVPIDPTCMHTRSP